MKVRTVILPVAGNGTRMLPATKSVPKELLPVYDTPVLQFALDEAISAGAERIVLVSHRSKVAIEEYLSVSEGLEATLKQKGKVQLLRRLQSARIPEKVDVRLVYQDEARGLGHAVLCARDECLPGPVGVILPDDLIVGTSCLGQMVDAFDPERMNSLIASLRVNEDEISSYGVFDFEGSDTVGKPRAARGLVEKPDPDKAPSLFAAIGRYVLSEEIFVALENTQPGAGNEIQLTDAIAACGRIYGLAVRSPRFDCGCHEGLFAAGQFMRKLKTSRSSEAIAAE